MSHLENTVSIGFVTKQFEAAKQVWTGAFRGNEMRCGCKCVLNGLPAGDFPVSIFDVVLKRLTIRGSIVGTRQDMQEPLQFAAEGKVKAIIETQPLEEINTVFDRLRRGDVQGRVVIKMAERADVSTQNRS